MKKESLKLHGGKLCVYKYIYIYIKSPCNINKHHVVLKCAFPNCQGGNFLLNLFQPEVQKQDMKIAAKSFKR